jgi:hypothetical protein
VAKPRPRNQRQLAGGVASSVANARAMGTVGVCRPCKRCTADFSGVLGGTGSAWTVSYLVHLTKTSLGAPRGL